MKEVKKTDIVWSLSSAFEEETPETTVREVPPTRRQKLWWLAPLLALIVLGVCVAIAVPLAVTFSNRKKADEQPYIDTAQPQSSALLQGYDPDIVWKNTHLDPETWRDKTGFNTTITLHNVGGLSVMGLYTDWDDSKAPYEGAPRLNESWEYGKRPIHGVNLGGWLVLEPFITPSLFGGSRVDEYSLSRELERSGGAGRVHRVLENHYASFVTEKDFEIMAQAGIDHVRIPLAYWAVQPVQGEPYLPLVSWRYLLRGIEWARKSGLRVSLDLHSVPGSQNGWNHSGRSDSGARWLNSTDPEGQEFGTTSLDIHRKLAKFFAQDRYKNIVTMYGLLNEPLTRSLGSDRVLQWHRDAYDIVREQGYNGYIVYGDGLMGPDFYNSPGIFDPKDYPKMVLDLHQYMVFDAYLLGLPHGAKQAAVCYDWANMLDRTDVPVLIGEWSIADNDCATYLNSVGSGTRWEGSFNATDESAAVAQPICAGGGCVCEPIMANSTLGYPPVYLDWLREFASNQMATYESHGSWGWMYWTWKTESSPQWSFRTLYEEGLIDVGPTSNMTLGCTLSDWVVRGLPEIY